MAHNLKAQVFKLSITLQGWENQQKKKKKVCDFPHPCSIFHLHGEHCVKKPQSPKEYLQSKSQIPMKLFNANRALLRCIITPIFLRNGIFL